MKWVKASKRLPPLEKMLVLKHEGGTIDLGNFYEEDQCYMCYFQRNGAHEEYKIPHTRFMGLEWLDESEDQETSALRAENERMTAENAALRARLQEEEKEAETWQDSAIILEAKYNAIRTAIKDFCATIRIDNGNVYLPGFNEALEKLKPLI